jgi:hypothetical protein
MPLTRGDFESHLFAKRHGSLRSVIFMPYVEMAVTVIAAVALAWLADIATGRRDLPGFIVVALTGALGGAFLVLRVFALSTLDSWMWPVGAAIGSLAAIILYFLFRKQR